MSDGRKTTANMLSGSFPGCEDPSLASTLVRLLARGRPVTAHALADAAGRDHAAVASQLARWPNVERDDADAIVAFSGLTLRPTKHAVEIDGRPLWAWCAWDTLFLPALVGVRARVASACAVTGRAVSLVVAPSGVEHSEPARLRLSFPAATTANRSDIKGSFCRHVHFLAGPEAVRAWQEAQPQGEVLDLVAAFELGRRAIAPLTDPGSGPACC